VTEPSKMPPADSAANQPSDATNGSELDKRIAELQTRITELEQQTKDKENKYLYLYAEFENYKKRVFRERTDLVKFGWEPVARELLQVQDNLERALAHIAPGTDKTLVDGLNMVLAQFKSSLEKQGVAPVETDRKMFDPNLHEAIGKETSDLPAGTITQEHSRGYMLHGRLLRPARVVVSEGRSNGKD
jgi:molecular chaperone GrpE